MLRALFAVSLTALLAGCASAPKLPITQPGTSIAHKKAPVVAKAKPVEATTPNQIVKKRWYDRFKVHPKWFSK